MIYFIKDTVSQEIKIGYSKRSPEQRLRDLQTGNPHKLLLLGSISGRRDDEGCFHSRFAKHQLEGEWFNGLIIEEVLAIISEHAQQRRTKRRTMSDATTSAPKTDGPPPNGEPANGPPPNGAPDTAPATEGISRIPGLRLKCLSVTLTEKPSEQQPNRVDCGAEIVYVLEFEADVTDETILDKLRTDLLCVEVPHAKKKLKHVFVDADNAVIPFSPYHQSHHIVGGREAITGCAGDGIRVLVAWIKALDSNYGGASIKSVFMGENYTGEHPLKKARKLLVSIR